MNEVYYSRWKFGGYDLKINPKSYEKSKSASTGVTMVASGVVTNPNLFYDNKIKFSFDIYDHPTSYTGNIVKTFSANAYTSVTEERITDYLYVLKPSNTFDIINKNGTTISSNIGINLSSGSVCAAIHHIDNNQLAGVYPNGALAIFGETGAQVSKYTYSDLDIRDGTSIATDYQNNIYVLNKFGKLALIDKSTGQLTWIYQAPDFANNKILNQARYGGLHIKDGYFGFIKDKILTYLDADYSVSYAVDLNTGKTYAGLSYSNLSGDFYYLSSTFLQSFQPNVCGLDILKVKNELANGIVQITDEMKSVKSVIVKGVGIARLRNKQESRYEISIDGILM